MTHPHYLRDPRSRARAVLATALLVACSRETLPEHEIRTDGFAGSEACGDCHPGAFADWEGSLHDRALAEATAANVLGHFDGVDFDDGTVRARFTRDSSGFHVETPGVDGQSDLFKVAYVIGVDPLQQLLIEEPRGHLQAFSIAWDTRADRWFALHRAGTEPGKATPGDWLHWTGSAFNANSMCIECHATNVDVGFRSESRDYETTWSEAGVACEACHGPRAPHATTQMSEADPRSKTRNRTGSPGAAAQDRDRQRQQAELESCGPCHSRRRRIHDKPSPGESFDDRYALELVREGLYSPDGQILDEVYVLGSFLQSRMYAEGVRCTHCHDPHTLKLVAEGNDLCSKCHDARYDNRSHHHHAEGSPGSQCVECHMRTRTYMQVDPRRDHGFHLPRPDQSVEFGVPNACNACHTDRDANWALDHVLDWYGPERPHDVHATAAFAADRSGGADADRLLGQAYDDPATPPILRATALSRLAARGESQRRRRISTGLASDDPMLRATAAAAAESLPPSARFELLAPLASDPSRSVRTEVGRILGGLALQRRDEPRDDSDPAVLEAWNEYLAVQRSLGSQPGAEMNLAIANARRGGFDAAEDHYQRALELDGDFLPARFNLALLYEGQGRSREAEVQLRAALDTDPELGEAHYSLGLLLAADPARSQETAESLAEAASRLPERPRVHYNAGLAHQRLGRGPAAKAFLEEALRLEPGSPDFRIALAILAAQQGEWNEARSQVQRFSREHPEDARGKALLLRLRQPEPSSH